LENGLLCPEEEQRAKRKLQSRYADRNSLQDDLDMGDGPAETSDLDISKLKRYKRRSRSPKAPPGGRYRIPEKGQLQIIIKNQNTTAGKLFLVPYDLVGMEPGTKTFIRQRSYSAGPIIDSVPGLNEAGTSDRPILRYLIHLHICCPSKGRYYLYKSIRVVFANRVPDGKEKLRNEVTYPEPRFTPYKHIRMMHPPTPQAREPGAIFAAEKAFRRRSSGFSFGQYAQATGLDGAPNLFLNSLGRPSSPFAFGGGNVPVEPTMLKLPMSPLRRKSAEEGDTVALQIRPPGLSQTPRPPTQELSSQSTLTVENGMGTYDKLSKGDIGYGGNAFIAPWTNGSPGAAEGLLSKRLRSLGVQSRTQDDSKAR
jgi:hypothetical protein